MPTPTTPSERDASIDALRGLCLLGIAIVNVPWIGMLRSLPYYLFDPQLRAATPLHDLIAAGGIEWLCEGKFYPQFSALFGLGAGALLARGMPSYLRRIAVLAISGLLHSAFGWWGDILLDYALVGALLAMLWYLPTRGLLTFGVIAYVAACTLSLVFDDWMMGEPDPGAAARAEESRALYQDGSFWEICDARFTESVLEFFARWEWSYRLNTLAMASLGLWAHKRGLLKDLASKRRALGRTTLLFGGLGLLTALAPFLYIAAGDVLAIGYAAFFLWIATGRSGPAIQRWLAPLGRMAITGYLGQTVAFTLFFYSYGLAMYGRLGPLQGLLLAATVWTAEVIFARLWLSRFAIGPVEWLWRSLTYLRAIPMRRPSA